MPLVLDVLVALGLFYLKQGSAGLAAEVLQFVRGDPAAKKETDGQARLLLKRCASSGASVGRSRGRIEDVLQNIYSH